jgi:hypothetical protein
MFNCGFRGLAAVYVYKHFILSLMNPEYDKYSVRRNTETSWTYAAANPPEAEVTKRLRVFENRALKWTFVSGGCRSYGTRSFVKSVTPWLMHRTCTTHWLCDKCIHSYSQMTWWSPCHHGMARPQVADGGDRDRLQVWRVAANILNKQSRTADKRWSSGFECWTNNSSPQKNYLFTKCHKGPRIWRDPLDTGQVKWTWAWYVERKKSV